MMENKNNIDNNSNSQENSKNSISALTKENATKSNAIEIPEISLPKGGGALKGIDEKFEVNAANGTAAFSIPLPVTPGRNGFSPSLSLSYNSGGGNSPYGLGWSVGYPSIQRKTDKQLPRYKDGEDEDVFMFSGAEDLVPFLTEGDEGDWQRLEYRDGDYEIRRYRPRIEGSFARIEKISHPEHGIYWKVTTRENVVTIFGRNANARIADPADDTRIFQWLPEFSYDDKGNWIKYEYKEENLDNVPDELYEKNRRNGTAGFTNRYLKRIQYGNRKPYYADADKPYDPQPPDNNEHFFEVVFDYGEHDDSIPTPTDDLVPNPTKDRLWDYRADAFSNYRAGFEIRTNRLCKRVLMFHHFKDEPGFGKDVLVRSLDFKYEPSSINGSDQTEVTYLQAIIQTGYIRKKDSEGNYSYSKKSLPPMEFDYQRLNWNTEIRTVSRENIVNAPVGLTNNYQWVDLYGEGISGILTEQGNGWFYKSNWGDVDEDGDVRFTPARPVIPKPSLMGIASGVLSLRDLEANGQKQVVVNSPGVQGFFELTIDNEWEPFRAFEETANINLQDPNVRTIDLDGDGQPELVVSEDNVFVWYPANGKKGYSAAEFAAKTFDEEKGPAIIFADRDQTIFLADLSGDGLTDIVRIRNGEICYWANMGYGRFSAKVNMSNAPLFDHPGSFNPRYLHLADVSGTGATDIIYLGKNKFKSYINLSGNAWSDAHEIEPFFPIDSNTQMSVIDLLGSGTSCIVWSSDLPGFAEAPMRYIDLMDSKKPHVLVHYKNNFGKETSLEYKSSTHFYLKDKLAGKPWITKLPFPVQVVSKHIIEEKITDVRFTTEYRYHHGYYDHPEREFRGFGMVEQVDTELYEDWQANNEGNRLESSQELYQAPVLTKTWFHTGAFLDKERILTQFKEEYWYEEYNRAFTDDPIAVDEPQLPDARLIKAESIDNETIIDQLNADEWREALRACKGMVLRQEVFALDASSEEEPKDEAFKKQMIPYTAATHNCNIQLLQPRNKQPYAVFLVTESEALTFNYERDPFDPRIAHTLNIEIDDRGNVVQSASVVYGRNPAKANAVFQGLKDTVTDFSDSDEKTKLQDAFEKAMDDTKTEQEKSHIIYTKNTFTNDIDDISRPQAYRLRAAAETKTYEITGLSPSDRLFSIRDFKIDIFNNVNRLEYHQAPTDDTLQHRLIEHIRTLYYRDDLTGPLLLKKLEPKGIPFESYQLAYTPDLLTEIYGEKITNQEDIMAEGQFHKWENKWWIRSGTIEYDSTFYLPKSYTDPFGSKTIVEYDNYYLMMKSSEDELHNKISVEQFNFRTLSPVKMRDINDNLSEVLIDELGLVKAVALLGKDLDGDGMVELEIADNLSGLEESTETEDTAILDFFKTEDSEDLKGIGKDLLQQATSRFVYDFDRYKVIDDQNKNYIKDGNPELVKPLPPVVVASINRETHHAHLTDGEQTKLQLSFEYSDGLGNLTMSKVQAEPGKAKKATVNPDGSYTVSIINTAESDPKRLRWIGNGRTVLNNKGNPVKLYEPYFSVTPFYEDAKELVENGVTPIMYYDSLSRLIKTELPDRTFSKVEFDAWKQVNYDQNDTVKDSEWYTERISLTAGSSQEQAAKKAGAHHNTPSSIYMDSLGRPILSIAHNGRDESEEKDKLYATFIELDIEGNARKVIDARGNTVMEYNYDMLGHRVYQNSMDAGERWMLNNVMGNPVKSWDSRDHIFSFSYDDLQRPTEMMVEGGEGDEGLNNIYEKIKYGEGQSDDKGKNLRGQVFEHYDTAGKVQFFKYNFKGNALKTTRWLAKEYIEVVDWKRVDLNSKLEPEPFTTESQFDALSRVAWSKTPDESITEPGYNEANLLEAIAVTQPEAPKKEYVKNIDYDAKGQRIKIEYGNNVYTNYTYDEKTFRLVHLETKKKGGLLLQDLYYTYDPVGNIIEIEDRSIPTIFQSNQEIEPRLIYTYDPLYRLIRAKGKELKTQIHFGDKDNWNDLPFLKELNTVDPLALRNYIQTYLYDPVGNIGQMRHIADGGCWTRDYEYEIDNNRLKNTRIEENTYTYPHHPTHGFIERMPHLQKIKWNFKDELQAVSKQRRTDGGTSETTYYVYDSEGQRVRKVTENQAAAGETPTKKSERLYLCGIEIFRKHSDPNKGLERTTLHIMDDTQRIAMIDTRNEKDDGTAPRTVRYQLGNHLGSTSLEINDGNNPGVINYEEYHPYGTTAYQATNKRIKAAAKRYRYTGMERDEESGLNYHTARYYMPWLGRWLNDDPIGINGGLNVYAYSRDNSVHFSDTSGTDCNERDVSTCPQGEPVPPPPTTGTLLPSAEPHGGEPSTPDLPEARERTPYQLHQDLIDAISDSSRRFRLRGGLLSPEYRAERYPVTGIDQIGPSLGRAFEVVWDEHPQLQADLKEFGLEVLRQHWAGILFVGVFGLTATSLYALANQWEPASTVSGLLPTFIPDRPFQLGEEQPISPGNLFFRQGYFSLSESTTIGGDEGENPVGLFPTFQLRGQIFNRDITITTGLNARFLPELLQFRFQESIGLYLNITRFDLGPYQGSFSTGARLNLYQQINLQQSAGSTSLPAEGALLLHLRIQEPPTPRRP
ncbi:MAG: SpvB/TcaC N-terminal domain-containing protein [Candidatus Aminicenantes bacterium]|jgi:RHS repeat-associated protein